MTHPGNGHGPGRGGPWDSAPDARRVAADVLAAVESGRWSDEVLARALATTGLADADRALATRIVYGVLARQRTLDHTIAAYAARGAARIDASVRIAARIGLFQLRFLDRVPDHAAVSTSVDLAPKRARGFVNALLRRAQREGLAPPPSSGAARTGVELSHPDWLVEMWTRELGADDAAALMAANNDAAPTCYRALGERAAALAALRADGVEAHPGRWAPTALVVDGPVRRLDGVAVVQGEASQLVVAMLDAQRGERVLDACAAPGGKTAALAARVGGDGHVTACDPSRDGVDRIRATLRAAGEADANVRLHAGGIADLDAAPASFDAVLVDAPCSGLGTLRQHPEIRWRRSPSDLADLASRQRAILAAGAAFVRPGGRLVYSTCTIARAENDDVVAAFLADSADFERDDAAALPACVKELVDDDGNLRTFPHRHGLDGFFAVRLRRRAAAA